MYAISLIYLLNWLLFFFFFFLTSKTIWAEHRSIQSAHPAWHSIDSPVCHSNYQHQANQPAAQTTTSEWDTPVQWWVARIYRWVYSIGICQMWCQTYVRNMCIILGCTLHEAALKCMWIQSNNLSYIHCGINIVITVQRQCNYSLSVSVIIQVVIRFTGWMSKHSLPGNR